MDFKLALLACLCQGSPEDSIGRLSLVRDLAFLHLPGYPTTCYSLLVQSQVWLLELLVWLGLFRDHTDCVRSAEIGQVAQVSRFN